MKTCSKCKLDKDLDQFAWRSKKAGTRQAYCKSCHLAYRQLHYEDNRQKYIDKAARWREEQKVIFYHWLSSQSCLDCGNPDMRVLEFDHLDDKSYAIADKIGRVKFEILQEEIAKCDVVCANCHKIRTAERGEFYKYLAT